MRRIRSWAATAALLAASAGGWFQAPAYGQSGAAPTAGSTATTESLPPAGQQDSLADAARRAREAKKDAPKPAKVFDNDNLPGSGGISTVGAAADADAGTATADSTAAAAKPAGGEKEWKQKFADLRATLARDQADLDVMQRELGVLNLQNYNDPVKGMQQDLTRGDINKKTADIDAKRKKIAEDQQAIDDATEDLRKSGGNPGWAR
jgi:hypothetical protein